MPITANIASTAIQTAAMIAASRLWLSGQLQSTWGRWGSTSSPGSTPIVSAQARIAPATTVSSSVSTISVAPSVGYVVPCTRSCTR